MKLNSGLDVDAETIQLEYSSTIKTQFRIVMVIIALFIGVMPWFQLFTTAWFQLSFILEILLVLYYLYRIRRRIVVTSEGISEYVGRQEWEWTWNDIAEVRETIANNSGSLPTRRLVVEHHSTHDIAIDDQMDGYDQAVQLIETHWHNPPKQRIERTEIPVILLRYW